MSSSETTAPRHHAFTGPALPQLSEPTYSERIRTLMLLTSVATLSTISRKHGGFPFGSLMPFALDSLGRPIFLISNMAMHTQNLKADPRCSLFVGQTTADGDALGAARATMIGNAEPVPGNDGGDARERYLARHESSRYWVDFSDFSFFRLQPIDLYNLACTYAQLSVLVEHVATSPASSERADLAARGVETLTRAISAATSPTI